MPTTITPKNNGPLLISGEFQILDPSGAIFDLAGRTAVSLCRCGGSKKKPFCDGTHKTNGFSSVVTAFALGPVVQKP
jgi:CDGSH-type Zn-finger protein